MQTRFSPSIGTITSVLLLPLPCCYYYFRAATTTSVLLLPLPCCYYYFRAATTTSVLLLLLPCCYYHFRVLYPPPFLCVTLYVARVDECACASKHKTMLGTRLGMQTGADNRGAPFA
ncbi:hypothetical protein POVWA2_003970 [Plasmodium ovale wallikeri]|uniref:Uncharacterized protein n=1 Tax=Plasmodium ovale wallikeri TaxID=864142 RepID=A0A1A8YGW1_PLAOA|nr:hypothetical protein POVWA1_003820 [Plasmodium ovale wallikeri]SBT31400.1 hypothetical protein POVWA2_003970 [Plasmodium ovale wallikeri]